MKIKVVFHTALPCNFRIRSGPACGEVRPENPSQYLPKYER